MEGKNSCKKKKKKNTAKCLQCLCGVVEIGITSFLPFCGFCVTTWGGKKKKHFKICLCVLCREGSVLQKPWECCLSKYTAPDDHHVGCHGLSATSLIWGSRLPPTLVQEIPLVDLTATSHLIQAEKPNHVSHLELQDRACNSCLAALNTKVYTTCEKVRFFW